VGLPSGNLELSDRLRHCLDEDGYGYAIVICLVNLEGDFVVLRMVAEGERQRTERKGADEFREDSLNHL
jgi:hypothetical protein